MSCPKGSQDLGPLWITMIQTMILLFAVQMLPENWSWALAWQGTVAAEFTELHSSCLSQHIPCEKKTSVALPQTSFLFSGVVGLGQKRESAYSKHTPFKNVCECGQMIRGVKCIVNAKCIPSSWRGLRGFVYNGQRIPGLWAELKAALQQQHGSH